MMDNYEQIDDENLRQLLTIQRQNLAHLEERAAKIGSVNIPLELVNQTRDVREAITHITREFTKRGLYQAGIRNKDEREIIALRQLRTPLNRHIYVLMNMYKASVEQKPQRQITEIRELFNDDYFRDIAYFDFSKQAPVFPDMQWFDYLQQQFNEFKEALDNTIKKYGDYLSIEVVDYMEQLINSQLYSFVVQTPMIRELDRQKGYVRNYAFFAHESMTNMVREYIQPLLHLVEYYNSLSTDENKIKMFEDLWRDDVSPLVGSARSALS